MAGYGRWLLLLCLLGLGCGGVAKTGDLQTRAVSLNDEGYQDYSQGRSCGCRRQVLPGPEAQPPH